MALCPLCQSEKPFFAPRCSSCNANIGFLHQLVGMSIYYGVIFGGMYLAYKWLTSF